MKSLPSKEVHNAVLDEASTAVPLEKIRPVVKYVRYPRVPVYIIKREVIGAVSVGLLPAVNNLLSAIGALALLAPIRSSFQRYQNGGGERFTLVIHVKDIRRRASERCLSPHQRLINKIIRRQRCGDAGH